MYDTVEGQLRRQVNLFICQPGAEGKIHFSFQTNTFCKFDKYICFCAEEQHRRQVKLFICQVGAEGEVGAGERGWRLH